MGRRGILDLDSGKEVILSGDVRENADGSFKSDMTRIRSVELVIPHKIEGYLRAMSTKFPHVEFSILANSYFNPETKSYYVDPDSVCIPRQNVNAAFIEYLEDKPECNTVFHKHPDGCRGFSGTDAEYINANFKFSILWVDMSFAVAIANTCIEPGVFLEIPVKISKEIRYSQDFPEGIENIIEQGGNRFTGGYAHIGGHYGYGCGIGGRSPRLNQRLQNLLGGTDTEDGPTELK